MAAIGVHLGATCACAAVYKVRAAPLGGLGRARSAARGVPSAVQPPGAHGCASLPLLPQDGRADVVANDAGDRVTPAVVAFSESEEVRLPLRGVCGEEEEEEEGRRLCLLLGFSFLVFIYFSFRLLA